LLIALALFAFLWSIRKRVGPDGVLGMLYLALYSISQFFIFFLRDNTVVLGGLKQAQVTAIIVLAVSLPIMAYLLRRQRSTSQPEPALAAEVSEPTKPAEAAPTPAPRPESQAG
jgi:prolipoprotein diacylglyceryltransferase